jgi:hypothetical protein
VPIGAKGRSIPAGEARDALQRRSVDFGSPGAMPSRWGCQVLPRLGLDRGRDLLFGIGVKLDGTPSFTSAGSASDP